jgi:hypothetical protein
VGNEQYLPHHSSGDIRSTRLPLQHGHADKLYGALAIHLPTTSSHHRLQQPPCAPHPSHIFSGQLNPYPSRHLW